MKLWTTLALICSLGQSAHAIPALSSNLVGEWRENCLKALELSAKDEGAPFVQYKLILGADGSMEHVYSTFSDKECTKRKSRKREFSKYRVLESRKGKTKLLVRKDLGDGVISESIVEVSLPKKNGMEFKTLSTKIELDDLLSDNPLAEVGKNSGSGESVKNLSRFDDAKPVQKKM